ncbi:hypothetical protein M703_10695 [Neisseria gonorrhoeae SK29344]|uniref:Uncharacterized protein n=1 Tax=Neisseria gonorrhoeae 3502 TaxID=1193404 RepID=A0AA44ZG52_NEIGO|nr:hypothetical protein M717_08235 [Neisseria gonorrhoeae SK33414]KLR79416.1 hypothetical protein M680_11420 [Neisseria gonorrhoeae SK8976]KLR82210.1 hypothetical protein M679_06760 [Neisseria gonorrhoeae SK7842]KLR84146.1 hypothetical protein M684_11295 [Neisseria gonorrhoeae SK15454]KLR86320.1 hypothetical protein M675_08325 [Neisseria gonorrhoeae SK1902]KLR88523.1 hypothetical protein M677_11255 [Neisseria gonorrhoeae SK6987]KLR89599.1 hypothetical protein M702_10610 [Neisseria gonorrhoeae
MTKKCSKTSSSPPSNPPGAKPKKPQTKQWAHSPKICPPAWATSSADPDRHSRERGNPVTEKPQESIGKKQKPPPPSFPRRRESRT